MDRCCDESPAGFLDIDAKNVNVQYSLASKLKGMAMRSRMLPALSHQGDCALREAQTMAQLKLCTRWRARVGSRGPEECPIFYPKKECPVSYQQ